MNEEEIKKFIFSKNISSCKDLHKHFIGRHRVIPVYLTPKFEIEFEYIMNKLEDLEKENQKYKEVINKIKQICDSIPNTHSICGIEKIHDIEKALKGVKNT